MSLKEQVYSVLLVSSAEKFNTDMARFLPEAEYSPVVKAGSISAAQRAVAERSYDFIIINAPLSDDLGVRFAIDSSVSSGACVLLLVRAELYSDICDKASRHGVFTLPKPITKQAMETALRWLAASREKVKRFEKKSVSVEDKMKEIRTVNKAKWLLISNEGMEEPEAHRYLEKEAMNRCISKLQFADEVIKKYS